MNEMALIGEIINNALVLSLQRAEPNATSILWYELILLKNRFLTRKNDTLIDGNNDAS